MFKERDLTALFSKFMRTDPSAQYLKFSMAIEFKCKYGNKPLNFKRDFQPQQIPALLKILSGCYYHKLSDMSIGIKGFDSFQLCHCPAFIGVMWYKPRTDKILYLIDPRDIKELDKLYEDKASELAIYTIYLNSKKKSIDIK